MEIKELFGRKNPLVNDAVLSKMTSLVSKIEEQEGVFIVAGECAAQDGCFTDTPTNKSASILIVFNNESNVVSKKYSLL